jgi:(E)-4-hydroxy-3-methylbut-2-enyl-diphosphate synthase
VVREAEERLTDWPASIQVAIMGCGVNGPGEAREADLGIAAGKGVALLFRKGRIIRKIRPEEMVSALMAEVQTLQKED